MNLDTLLEINVGSSPIFDSRPVYVYRNALYRTSLAFQSLDSSRHRVTLYMALFYPLNKELKRRNERSSRA